MTWTVNDISDQSGKTAIVTGANIGLGLSTARALAEKGADIILACRNLEKAESAAADIRVAAPKANVRTSALDLSDFDSIRAFAGRESEALSQLDLLINNAGVMIPPKSFTKQGFELQFGTNHLGHFLLTGLMLPVLRKAPAARIIALSSVAHRRGKIDFTSFKSEHGYSRMGAYAQSKLANLMFALELQRRLAKNGDSIQAIAAHPGFSNTNLGQYVPLFRLLSPLISQSADTGALPTLRAATDPMAQGGEYYGPAKLGGVYGPPVLETPRKQALDEAVAAQLWTVSEALTGMNYL